MLDEQHQTPFVVHSVTRIGKFGKADYKLQCDQCFRCTARFPALSEFDFQITLIDLNGSSATGESRILRYGLDL